VRSWRGPLPWLPRCGLEPDAGECRIHGPRGSLEQLAGYVDEADVGLKSCTQRLDGLLCVVAGAVEAPVDGVLDAPARRRAPPRGRPAPRPGRGPAAAAQAVAANVDVALVVATLSRDVSLRGLERYLALAWESGALPVVVLTKTDLAEDVASSVAEAQLVAPGVDVVALSSVTGEGIDALERLLHPRRTAVLLGPSGAGKSTLINRLLGAERLRTAEARADGKGRHTTTHRELVRLRGGALLIDTPGMRELQLWDANAGLGATFADIQELSAGCRFRDCRHETEPACAVRAAVDVGRLAAERLESWRKLERELAWLVRRQDERAAALDKARAKSAERLGRARLREKGRDKGR
jgi:ribosome biogenesis GTPase / thiamine phosphate phosphatase